MLSVFTTKAKRGFRLSPEWRGFMAWKAKFS